MKQSTKSADWQVQTAKAKFSELFRKARTEGPQRVTKQGKETIVVLSIEDYDKLTHGKRPPKNSFWKMLRESPLVGLELEFERDKSPMRDIEL
jgi:prevent-host-death family protein